MSVPPPNPSAPTCPPSLYLTCSSGSKQTVKGQKAAAWEHCKYSNLSVFPASAARCVFVFFSSPPPRPHGNAGDFFFFFGVWSLNHKAGETAGVCPALAYQRSHRRLRPLPFVSIWEALLISPVREMTLSEQFVLISQLKASVRNVQQQGQLSSCPPLFSDDFKTLNGYFNDKIR